MKSTTKIIIGIIVSIFTLSILFIIYASILFKDKSKNFNSDWTSDLSFYIIPQGAVETLNLGSFKVVSLESTSEVKNNNERLMGTLLLQSQKAKQGSNQLAVSGNLKAYINTKNVGDTLKIFIDCSAIHKAYENKKEDRYIGIKGVDLTMYLSIPNVEIINQINDFSIVANDLEAEKVNLSTQRGEVKVTSSKIAHLNAESVNGYLSVDKSSIDTLTLDLDNLSGWNIANSRIDVENLTGSRYHSIRQSKTESNTVNWTPKNKSAELNITIPNDTVKIIFP